MTPPNNELTRLNEESRFQLLPNRTTYIAVKINKCNREHIVTFNKRNNAYERESTINNTLLKCERRGLGD